jgi:hypothetical protein
VTAVAGWWADQRQASVAYLIDENRILRGHLGGRLRLTDDERRRLAAHGHRLGRRRLRQVATIVTPDTILRVIACSSRESGTPISDTWVTLFALFEGRGHAVGRVNGSPLRRVRDLAPKIREKLRRQTIAPHLPAISTVHAVLDRTAW